MDSLQGYEKPSFLVFSAYQDDTDYDQGTKYPSILLSRLDRPGFMPIIGSSALKTTSHFKSTFSFNHVLLSKLRMPPADGEWGRDNSRH